MQYYYCTKCEREFEPKYRNQCKDPYTCPYCNAYMKYGDKQRCPTCEVERNTTCTGCGCGECLTCGYEFRCNPYGGWELRDVNVGTDFEINIDGKTEQKIVTFTWIDDKPVYAPYFSFPIEEARKLNKAYEHNCVPDKYPFKDFDIVPINVYRPVHMGDMLTLELTEPEYGTIVEKIQFPVATKDIGVVHAVMYLGGEWIMLNMVCPYCQGYTDGNSVHRPKYAYDDNSAFEPCYMVIDKRGGWKSIRG